MSTTRKHFAMLTYGDAAFAFGGQNSGNSDLNSMERWNRRLGWVAMASMPYTNFRFLTDLGPQSGLRVFTSGFVPSLMR